jgi:membrane-associated phospholipid phosphatase
VLLLLTGLVTLDVAVQGPLTGLDHVVHPFADAQVHGPWRRPFELLALPGQRGVLLLPIILLAAAAARRTRSLRPVVTAASVVAVLSVLQIALKTPLGRTWPVSGEDVLYAGGLAFPSGHVLNAFVLVGLLLELAVLAYPDLAHRMTRRRRGRAVAVAAVGTGVALVALDAHWLTDVLASWALGPVLYAAMLAAFVRWATRPVVARP